jgi:hypothetical protein
LKLTTCKRKEKKTTRPCKHINIKGGNIQKVVKSKKLLALGHYRANIQKFTKAFLSYNLVEHQLPPFLQKKSNKKSWKRSYSLDVQIPNNLLKKLPLCVFQNSINYFFTALVDF